MNFRILPTFLNVVAVLGAIASTWIVVHRLYPARPPLHFRLRSLMKLVAVVAIISAILVREQSPELRLFAELHPSLVDYYPVTMYPLWVSVPVLGGVACAAYFAIGILISCGQAMLLLGGRLCVLCPDLVRCLIGTAIMVGGGIRVIPTT